ncbi:MAG: class I SAM-dependent methyltransferase [Caulobacteraceae bacterium]|nr:class I SAM-dependent methyltransferase [Caulobacter sp.]
MRVLSSRFVRRILTGGDIGFADSYVAGEWDTPDLAACLTAFAANFDAMAAMMKGQPWLRLGQALAHALNRNSRAGSRRNIHAHYDIGDDFYRLWLDAGMNYSSVLSFSPGDDLEAAQTRKHAALAQTMGLERGQSVLEIGCGWGGFAAFAAREYDARVTAVTISPSQHACTARRMQAAGLSDRVEVQLRDYRDVEGRFDRLASIEMFEAVGERYWPAYFATVRDRLLPGGRAGLQVITIDEALFDGYRRQPDFIQLHVFPGGMLPSERRLRQETDAAGLAWTDLRRFGQGYADTLREWGRRFAAAEPQVRAQGFDRRFERLWRYYLAYCEAGFRTGRTDVVQLGLARG